MKLSIVQRNKNPIMEREEVILIAEHPREPQPRRTDLEKILEQELGKKKGVFIIKRIESIFGSSSSRIIVNIYSNAEKRKYFEPSHALKKGVKPKEKKKKEEVKEEVKPQPEAKEEEVKEEVKPQPEEKGA